MEKKEELEPQLADSLATETSQGSTSIEQFDKRLARYAKAKDIALRNHKYISEELPQSNKVRRTAVKLRECGSYLCFHHYHTIGEIKLAYASMCKQSLLCPLCAIRRGAKLVSKYIDRYVSIMNESASLRPYMVTLTVKDGSDLSERFNHLQHSVKRYNKGRHRVHTKCEAKKAHSAVWSYEVKRGKGSRLWHPHMHAVWLCQEQPCQDELAKEWFEITKDSYIVDVRPIDIMDPVTGFLEVFKYAVKFSDQPSSDTWHCYEQLSGRRMIGSFGGFRGMPPIEDLEDDLLDDLPYIELFFRYINGSYSKHDRSEYQGN